MVPIVFLTAVQTDGQLAEGLSPTEGLFHYEKLMTPETFTEIEERLEYAAKGE
jgi:hypothetical protein